MSALRSTEKHSPDKRTLEKRTLEKPTIEKRTVEKRKLDLASLPLVKPLLRSRWPQFIVRTLALTGFLAAILAGLWGTPVGSHNFGIVFVWIAWWALLMLVAVPLFGRGWCSICPIPMPGEWLQQGALLGPRGGGWGLGRRWPNRWRNIWLQNGAFTLVALFSIIILTQPKVSAVVLVVFLLIATGVSLIFERRSFCRYLCPVGGFIGLYSQTAPIELRVKDSAVCSTHAEKTCYTGNTEGYGCPWQVFPAGLVKNTSCGLCMECLRTCPHDNLALNVRAFGADLEQASGRKLDEVYKGFIMLGSAMIYAAVLLGPWGALKAAANGIGTLPWLGYVLAFLTLVFGLLPGGFLLVVAAGRRWSGLSTEKLISWSANRKPFIALAYSLVPLGLAAWIAFSLAFVFTNFSYIWPALSDPFGWGWNLFGTSGMGWTPYITQWIPALQVVVLIGGLAWASRLAQQTAAQLIGADRSLSNISAEQAATRLALPVAMLCLVITAILMGLMVA